MPRARAKRLSAPLTPRKPPKDTGPSKATRKAVLDRAEGCCEVCGVELYVHGRWVDAHSVHHRRPRGMGGDPRPNTNSPANLLLVCGSGITGCHGLLESMRRHALENGWLVHTAVPDPAAVSVWLHTHQRAVWLTHDGHTTTTRPEAP